ncbi:hypothetical protein CH333_01965 [candidate division WOR-3 bacterium JGI_Cruoil_03_44_89]|uniref:histidine kinase n=1 Tax=candidate division WOR-3 bacterium JGI_Cruoil_03_44_89 TaxID=1973748 RepID=A0A235BZ66_UNCW3|nr:MAG: hypothetical protein CH333_01965 [candidate division WOR-3 bacterium JGI_Cruoil_03_44_89]
MTENRLLVIDDDPALRETLSDIFQEKGYIVDIASTGREAIDKARQTRFNVALIDIMLPDMEGIELLPPLKEMHSDMAVIMITAYASVETAVRALNEGAFAYIIKPLNMDEVLATIREALVKHRLLREKRQAEEKVKFYNSLLMHDISNKDQVIIGYLGLLKKTNLSKEQTGFVEKALRATRMSVDLIERVEYLAKIKKKRELEDVSLDSVMKKVVKNLSPIAKDKGIRIDYEPAKMMVRADSLLEDMFSNLVQNALIHSGCDEINIYTVKENGFCKVSIEDNGKGIPDNEKEKIFKRGVKEKKSINIGLYLVKTIAESYNGKVEVTNRIEKDYSRGTRFNIYIPKAAI